MGISELNQAKWRADSSTRTDPSILYIVVISQFSITVVTNTALQSLTFREALMNSNYSSAAR